ncbi:hypothetical protein [Pseudobacteriovorax antillogorgiicola]|uniref:Na+-driven multidrug efflux pump n=1 Tax=Pseudobacteriovorax antillogorgiicola TaxID=1513793 RepID=A0A1Y6BAK7_9BACT|nr:hypothetical protein [Pseudobacteriovorax antillogorgiicola]TCS58830.1 hypothetical protein EDD56_102345 [Pseudobacteriovorax antillogorgiicola]SME94184.1 hypothetical protein SAMN06296036_10298 [Pseudobacteriovorax antillogorgiicola]
MNQSLGSAAILKSWLPLASTWFMMAAEGPYIAAIIARMEQPDYNLAAFGVTFAIGLLMEAPVIMMMAASARLVKGKDSYHQLRRFNIAVSSCCTLLMMLMLIPPAFKFWTTSLLGLNEDVRALVLPAMVCMLAWPGMIGYRRFYQGILISNKNNKRVAVGTIIRLAAMSATAFAGFQGEILPGAAVGTLALSAGVTAEGLFVRLAARQRVNNLLRIADDDLDSLAMPAIIRFYYPLALTAMIGLTVQPLVTFAMGKAAFPLESLAVIPVVNSLVFFFRAIPLSFQEVIITLLGEDEENRKILKFFAYGISASLTVLLVILAFTPLSTLWFEGVSGLRPELASFAKLPLMISILTPATSLLLCWQRSILIHRKITSPVTWASAIELSSIALALCLGIFLSSYPGAVIASASLVLGRIASTSYLRIAHQV